jgi:hypothetical protein
VSRQELAGTEAATRKRVLATFRKPGSDVGALAVVQILCFLALARIESQFFIIHLYQLIPYVAILTLIAYGQQQWAYTIGPLVSVTWFALAYMAGLLGSAANLVAILAIVIAIVAALMTVLCRIHWMEEYSGRGPRWRTFLVSFGIVLAYFVILLRWFWDMISLPVQREY